MNLTTNLTVHQRLHIRLARHPEWWGWFFSFLVWSWLLINLPATSHDAPHSVSVAYCMPLGQVPPVMQSALTEEPFYVRPLAAISSGLLPWVMMVAAMMFPLLNEPIRHVAFSIRKRDSVFGVWDFLMGYTITWTLAGLLFLLLPLLLYRLADDQIHSINGLIKASGFLLAATLVWMPSRPVRLAKCGQTMPIRIQSWQLHWDSLRYGLKMGLVCLSMCWAPMAALTLAHHNIILMGVVTIIVVVERYLLPHTSKLPAYAWGTIALSLFAAEMWT